MLPLPTTRGGPGPNSHWPGQPRKAGPAKVGTWALAASIKASATAPKKSGICRTRARSGPGDARLFDPAGAVEETQYHAAESASLACPPSFREGRCWFAPSRRPGKETREGWRLSVCAPAPSALGPTCDFHSRGAEIRLKTEPLVHRSAMGGASRRSRRGHRCERVGIEEPLVGGCSGSWPVRPCHPGKRSKNLTFRCCNNLFHPPLAGTLPWPVSPGSSGERFQFGRTSNRQGRFFATCPSPYCDKSVSRQGNCPHGQNRGERPLANHQMDHVGPWRDVEPLSSDRTGYRSSIPYAPEARRGCFERGIHQGPVHRE